MKQNMQTLYKLLKDVNKSDDGVFDEIPSTCSMYQLGNTQGTTKKKLGTSTFLLCRLEQNQNKCLERFFGPNNSSPADLSGKEGRYFLAVSFY